MTFRPICSRIAGLQSQRAAPPKLRRVNFNQRRAGSLWQCITLNEAKRELSFSRAPATNGPRCYEDNPVSPLLFCPGCPFFLYLSLLFQPCLQFTQLQSGVSAPVMCLFGLFTDQFYIFLCTLNFLLWLRWAIYLLYVALTRFWGGFGNSFAA